MPPKAKPAAEPEAASGDGVELTVDVRSVRKHTGGTTELSEDEEDEALKALGLELSYKFMGGDDVVMPAMVLPRFSFSNTHTLAASEEFAVRFASEGALQIKLTRATADGNETIVERAWDLSGLLAGLLSLKTKVSAEGWPLDAAPWFVDHFEFTATVGRKMLSRELFDKLNPLSVSIIRMNDLPDLPESHERLKEYCQPVVARFSISGIDGVFETQPISQAQTLHFNYTKAILAGLIEEPNQWMAKLRAEPLQIEVHHQDKPPPPPPVEPEDGADAPVTLPYCGLPNLDAALLARPMPPDPFGVVSVPWTDLLEGETEMTYNNHVLVKRFEPNDNECEPRRANAKYSDQGSVLTVRLTIGKPLTPPDRKGPFQRMCVRFKYKNSDMLHTLVSCINAQNARALQLDPAMSTDERNKTLATVEIDRSKVEELDVITGFMVMDGAIRIAVLEGIAGGESMVALEQTARRSRPNDAEYKLLFDKDVSYDVRLYTAYDVTVRMIRLKYELRKLVHRADIYLPDQVAEPCRNAVIKLHDMSKAQRIRTVKATDMFPVVAELNWIDKKFGSVLSNDDVNGVPPRKEEDGKEILRDAENMTNAQKAKMVAKLEDEVLGDELTRPIARKALTEQQNEAYDEYLKQRTELGPHRCDFVEKNILAIVDDPRNKGKPKAEKIDYGEVYVYSGQKYQYTTLQKELMRKSLAKDNKNHYTYGKDYMSLSMAMVNEDELLQEQKRETVQKFIDPAGFVYPVPRTGAQNNEHPHKLTEARVEDLKQPWLDPSKRPKDIQLHDPPWVKAVGERPKLLNRDKEYERSVHVTSGGAALEALQTKAAEHNEWKSKLVVDDPQINLYLRTQGRTRPGQLDRNETMLHGPAFKKSLKYKTPKQNPQSLFLAEDFVDALKGDALNKEVRPEHHDALERSFRRVSKIARPPKAYVPIKPLQEHERTGAKWG